MIHKCKNVIEQKLNKFSLVDIFKIKPLNKDLINFLDQFDEIVTLEEQWLDGGFGSALLEMFSESQKFKKIKRFGLSKKYIFENGGRDYLIKTFGLDIDNIIQSLD